MSTATDSNLPAKMQALTANSFPKTSRIFNLLRNFKVSAVGNGVASVQRVPLPTPAPNQVLVKVTAVALNPTDWKHIDFLAPAGSRIGCDFSGVVTKIPSDPAQNTRGWKIGDRVGGTVHGGLYKDQGSFAEYLAADQDLLWKHPNSLDDVEAAAIGVSALTAMQGLNIYLGVPWADDTEAIKKQEQQAKKPAVLIYSGATTAGLMALQVARLGGYTPVTTCSPHSNDLVKKYGAEAAFDYNSPTAPEEIRKAYPDIKIAMDCFSEGGSTEFCAKVMAGHGGQVVTLLPTKVQTPGVTATPILAYTLMGKEFQWFAPIGPKYAAIPEHRVAAARYAKLLPQLVESGKIKPLPVEKFEGGLGSLVAQLDRLRRMEVRGKKLAGAV